MVWRSIRAADAGYLCFILANMEGYMYLEIIKQIVSNSTEKLFI